MSADLVSSISLDTLGLTPFTAAMIALGFGMFLLVFGLAGAFAAPPAHIRRLRSLARPTAHSDFDLVRGGDDAPDGFLGNFAPKAKSERSQIKKRLRQAGINHRHGVRNFYVSRIVLALGLPAAYLALQQLPADIVDTLGIHAIMARGEFSTQVQIMLGLTLAGYLAPGLMVRLYIRKRRRAIEEAFPNAMDLLQISAEAGLGFDAAIVRVSNELVETAPEIAEELMMMELELQAGKDRDRAFHDMVERIGIDDVAAFAKTMQQSMGIGTNVSQALQTYAVEMRQSRELKAQAKANRLPVQMSGIMAAFMMPVMLLITLSPVAIRWIRMIEAGHF